MNKLKIRVLAMLKKIKENMEKSWRKTHLRDIELAVVGCT